MCYLSATELFFYKKMYERERESSYCMSYIYFEFEFDCFGFGQMNDSPVGTRWMISAEL